MSGAIQIIQAIFGIVVIFLAIFAGVFAINAYNALCLVRSQSDKARRNASASCSSITGPKNLLLGGALVVFIAAVITLIEVIIYGSTANSSRSQWVGAIVTKVLTLVALLIGVILFGVVVGQMDGDSDTSSSDSTPSVVKVPRDLFTENIYQLTVNALTTTVFNTVIVIGLMSVWIVHRHDLGFLERAKKMVSAEARQDLADSVAHLATSAVNNLADRVSGLSDRGGNALM